MPISQGISKQVALKREVSYGQLIAAPLSGGRLLRRVTSAFNLTKETYQSDEIRTDYQMADFRHGVRSADGSISGELSAGSYSDLFAAALAKTFAVGFTSTTHAGTGAVTIGAAVSNVYPMTRVTGSWLADGFKVGDVFRITAGTGLDASVLNKNLQIVSITSATIAQIVPLNGSTLVGSASSAATVIAFQNKKCFVPQTAHTSDSFVVEEWYQNISQSEVYTGCKVNTIGISIPSTGMATLDINMMGKDLASTGVTQYFNAPTALGTAATFAGVNGIVAFNGAKVAVITDASININRNISNTTALGSNSIVESIDGRALVDGSISLYFIDAVARDAFKDETEVSLIFTLTSNNTATADFLSITIPRAKINSFTKDDGEGAITASCDFQALLSPASATDRDVTTIVIQDSLAV